MELRERNVESIRVNASAAGGDMGSNSSGSGASSSGSTEQLGTVFLAVAVACAGAVAFGYHLGIVNGPLEAIAMDLGIAGDKGLQGLVREARGQCRMMGSDFCFLDQLGGGDPYAVVEVVQQGAPCRHAALLQCPPCGAACGFIFMSLLSKPVVSWLVHLPYEAVISFISYCIYRSDALFFARYDMTFIK
jgi:hypothetical protein